MLLELLIVLILLGLPDHPGLPGGETLVHLTVLSAQVTNSSHGRMEDLTAAGETAGIVILSVLTIPGVFPGDLLVEMLARQVIVESHLVALSVPTNNAGLALHPPRVGFTVSARGASRVLSCAWWFNGLRFTGLRFQ